MYDLLGPWEMCPLCWSSSELDLYTCACAPMHPIRGIWAEKGAAGADVCRERKTDCPGRDVCSAGEVNKIEAVLWWIRNRPWKRKYVVNLPGEQRWTAWWAHPGEGILICSAPPPPPPQCLALCWETVPHSVWASVRHRYGNYESDEDRKVEAVER